MPWQTFRGLNALAHKDHALLLALSRGEFALNGFHNADARIASSAGQLGAQISYRKPAALLRMFRTSEFPVPI